MTAWRRFNPSPLINETAGGGCFPPHRDFNATGEAASTSTGRLKSMSQQNQAQPTSTPQSGPRDLLARLYREIGISAVAAALECSKRQIGKRIEPGENPAVLREEKVA
jgi:hypothetical protein